MDCQTGFPCNHVQFCAGEQALTAALVYFQVHACAHALARAHACVRVLMHTHVQDCPLDNRDSRGERLFHFPTSLPFDSKAWKAASQVCSLRVCTHAACAQMDGWMCVCSHGVCVCVCVQGVCVCVHGLCGGWVWVWMCGWVWMRMVCVCVCACACCCPCRMTLKRVEDWLGSVRGWQASARAQEFGGCTTWHGLHISDHPIPSGVLCAAVQVHVPPHPYNAQSAPLSLHVLRRRSLRTQSSPAAVRRGSTSS